LTDPHIVVSLAISVVGSGLVELLQYQLLGHERRRVSLVALCHPVRSPLIVCQNGLAKLATAFHARPGSPWSLVHLVGGKLDDASVRLAARRYILNMAAGLTRIFALRLSHGVYRLAWLTFDDAPQAFDIADVDGFLC